MGYYDDHMRTNQQKRKWLLPTITGFILGIVILFIAIPFLAKYDLLPYDFSTEAVQKDDEERDTTQGNEQNNDLTPGDVTNVNVEITSQITNIVDEVSDAVVGVINIQNQSIFGRHSIIKRSGYRFWCYLQS